MKRTTGFFIGLWLVSIVLVAAVYIRDSRAQADIQTSQNLVAAVSALDNYYIQYNQMPASLQNLDASTTTAGVRYTKQSDTSYQVCATFSKPKADIDGNTDTNKNVMLKEAFVPESHPAGDVCYSYAEVDARLQNTAAKEQVGANCTNLQQTSFQSEPVKITNLDPQTAMITVGSTEYVLCKDVAILEKNGMATYSTDGFKKLKLGNTIVVNGSDKDHITSVTMQ